MTYTNSTKLIVNWKPNRDKLRRRREVGRKCKEKEGKDSK